MIHAVFGVIVGLFGGFCVALAVSEMESGAPSLAVCVTATAIAGAIVGGTKDITEAIRDTRRLNKKL